MISLTFALNLLFAGVLGTLALLALVRAFGRRMPRRGGVALLVGAWAAAVLVMTLRPGTGLGVRLNLVPILFDGPASAVDAVLNVGVFVPLGMLLALVAVRFRTVFVAALVLTLGIEVTQYISDLGRTADVNDVITNVLGACLGWAVVAGIRAPLGAGRAREARRKGTGADTGTGPGVGLGTGTDAGTGPVLSGARP